MFPKIMADYVYSQKELFQTQQAFDKTLSAADPAVVIKALNSINQWFAAKMDETSNFYDILKITQDKYVFITQNIFSKILLPQLKRRDERLAEQCLVYFTGRPFSLTNQVGVHKCTDIDFNMILGDKVAHLKSEVWAELIKIKTIMCNYFDMTLELDPRFTLLTMQELKKRFEQPQNLLFYKATEKNRYILSDQGNCIFNSSTIKKYIADKTKNLLESLVFEQNLGLFSTQNSLLRIYTDKKLTSIAEDGDQVELANVIGSEAFRIRHLQNSRYESNLKAPALWYFSMKYFVNRVYDYLCAMQARGYALADLNISKANYAYVLKATRAMQMLEEMKFFKIRSDLSIEPTPDKFDFTIISNQELKGFLTIRGKDFGAFFSTYIASLIESTDKKEKYLNLLENGNFDEATWIAFCIIKHRMLVIVNEIIKVAYGLEMNDYIRRFNHKSFPEYLKMMTEGE